MNLEDIKGNKTKNLVSAGTGEMRKRCGYRPLIK